ncbi:MAG: tetratricopeptide repeat protein [Chitinophagaceae bacterium]
MKRPQWITIGIAVFLVAVIFIFGQRVPKKSNTPAATAQTKLNAGLSTDTILQVAKRQLNQEQAGKLAMLESSISRGDVKDQQLKVYHQLGHFWIDSMGFFPPYAWYEGEAARLENSEKSLTFAAHLFLSNLQEDNGSDIELIKWKALQAKDLFERSLKINPDNDSSKVGLGACYLFGNISPTPMEGINKIREVTEKDSTNVYAQMMLVQGSLVSGQFDKAITRLNAVCRMHPQNIEAILMLADMYERTNDKTAAINWYRKSLPLIKRPDLKEVIEKRINDLTK